MNRTTVRNCLVAAALIIILLSAPAAAARIEIEGEKFVDANVQQTGAEWDSSLEKCPTWRGNNWSGTGDYYLSHGDDTLTYLMNAPESGNYVMWMRDWSDTTHAKGDREVTVTIDNIPIGTFDAASSFNRGITGYGWDKLTTVSLGAGSHILKITKKDTTSSAAIIDSMLFTTDVFTTPMGPAGEHSEALCTSPVTTMITPMIYCTPPPCPSGSFVCNQKDGCPGGCGMSCSIPTTMLPITSRTTEPLGIEAAVIILAIAAGVIFVGKRRM